MKLRKVPKMENSTLFVSKEIKGYTYQSPPVQIVSYEDFYVLKDAIDNIYSFDAITLSNLKFPPPDKAIMSKITCITVNPAHTLVAIGYDNGSIQIYDMITGKHKGFPKYRRGTVTNMTFINDSAFLLTDKYNMLVLIRITGNKLLGMNLKDTFLTTLQEKPTRIVCPPIYRPPDPSLKGKDAVSKCYAPSFAELFALTSEKQLIIALATQDRCRIVSTIGGPNMMITFILPNSETLFYAYASTTEVSLASLITESPPEVLMTHPLDLPPLHITFMTQSTVAIIQSDYSVLLLTLNHQDINKTTLEQRGMFITSSTSIKMFSNNKFINITFCSFMDRMEMFQNNNDTLGAIDFCKQIKSNTTTVAGIPTNQSQRISMIEGALTQILENYIRNNMTSEEKAKEIADFLIQLSFDLELENFLISNSIPIYLEMGYILVIFNKIIEIDPKAIKFVYTKNFTHLLLENCGDMQVSDFVLSLSPKVAPTEELLKFGIERKDTMLLTDIYLKRYNDYVSALTILTNSDRFDLACALLLDSIQVSDEPSENAVEMIKWVITSDEKLNYPQVQKIIIDDQENVIVSIMNFLKAFQKPITFEVFVNILIQSAANLNISVKHKIFLFIEYYILNTNVSLNYSSIHYLLPRIFTEEHNEPDQRENMLLTIINSDLDNSFKEKLIPLCNAFGFKNAKRSIQIATQKFDEIIRDAIADPKADAFSEIRKFIRLDGPAKEGARRSLIQNHILLIAKDVKQFVDIVLSYFPDINNELLSAISDSSTRNFYIRSLLIDPRSLSSDISEKDIQEYLKFISIYYPEDVRPFLVKSKHLNFENLDELFEKHRIIDACAFVYFRIGAMEKAIQYYHDYIEEQLIDFIDGKIDNVDNSVAFIEDFLLKTRSKKNPEIAIPMLQAFIAPLYEASEKAPERAQVVAEHLRKVSTIVADTLTFPEVLKFLITNFYGLKLATLRNTLCGVINDYDYDIDTTISLTNMFREDEKQTLHSFVSKASSGTHYYGNRCHTCHAPLFQGNNEICLFPCGHIFHGSNDSCLPKQICPICNPEERLTQDITPPTNKMLVPQVQRRLRRFEALLSEQKGRKVEMEKKAYISVLPIVELPPRI